MSLRENSVFNFMPRRTSYRSRSVAENSPPANQMSRYNKVMFIDGIKSGDVKQFQNNPLAPQKKKIEQAKLSPKFQNQLLNFLMVSVKNQYKDSYKKKQSQNYHKRAKVSVYKKTSSHSDGKQRFSSQKNCKIKDIFNVHKKQIIEQNSANCLKNKKLLNLKIGRDQKQFQLNFVSTSKQFLNSRHSRNSESKEKQEAVGSQSPHVLEDNQDVYLKSHIGDIVSKQIGSPKPRIKTEQFDTYLSDQYVNQCMSLDKQQQISIDKSTGNERPIKKSQGVRVLSALQLLANKKDTKKSSYFRGRFYDKNKCNMYQENQLLIKSVHEGNNGFKSFNHSFYPTSHKTPVYDRKKPVPRNKRSYIEQGSLDNFVITNKRK